MKVDTQSQRTLGILEDAELCSTLNQKEGEMNAVPTINAGAFVSIIEPYCLGCSSLPEYALPLQNSLCQTN